MSKKPRGKSGSAVGGANSKWEAGLLAAAIDEESWTANISVVVGNRIDDARHIDMLALAVQSGARRQFGIVYKSSLFEEVKDLGNPKNKKTKDSPAHIEVCEAVKACIDNGEEVPLPLLCRLIKFKILYLKLLDQQRILNEKKAISDKEKGGAKAGAKGGKDKPKSAKKGKGTKTPEPPSAKQGTKLKKRGDVDEKTYIDDEPLDGSSFYIIIAGFNHPHLLSQLWHIGVFVDSVMKIVSDCYPDKSFAPQVEIPKDEKTFALEEERLATMAREEKELESFWMDYPLLLMAASHNSRLQDTITEQLEVQSEWIPANLEDDKDGGKKLSYGMEVFERVAVNMYNTIDLKRQHKNFLASLRLTHVPVIGEETVETDAPVDTPVSVDTDTRYYNDLMNSVPQESISVSLIMHCMLEQIVASESHQQPPSEVQLTPRSDGLDHGLAEQLGNLVFKLSLTAKEREALLAKFEKPKFEDSVLHQPSLYNARDSIVYRTGHLASVYGFNAKNAELQMLDNLPFLETLRLPNQDSRLATERSARLQELLHFCADEELHPVDIDNAFKRFVLECMELTTTDESGNILPATPKDNGLSMYGTAIPWDDPYPYYRCMLPKRDEARLQKPQEASSDNARGAQTENAAGEMAGRPPTPGILKAVGGSSRSGSRNGSVHFSELGEMGPDGEGAQEVEFGDPMEQLVPLAHKRCLDEWYYAEHLDRHILLQVINEASFTLPFIDTYYHKRDHCLLVVMHNPFNGRLENRMEWCKKLHSNIGLRNYQEHVAQQIVEWTMTEEAKYQASLLVADVEKDLEDINKAAAVAAKDAKKNARARSKSPKGGRKGSVSSQSPKPVDPLTSYLNDGYIREGSLKAQKAEQERLVKEREEEERLKAEKADKRGKSAKKGGAESPKTKKKDDERKASRSGSKTRGKEEPEVSAEPTALVNEVPHHPFSGYDLANKLIHVNGKVSTLFPTDGSIIRTERIDFLQGSCHVKCSLVSKGNTFMIHVVDPSVDANHQLTDAVEKADLEGNEKNSIPAEANTEASAEPIGKYGSFTAVLKDGMSLSFSIYGAQGNPVNYKKYTPAPYTPSYSASPSPGPADQPKATQGKKKGKVGSTPEPVNQPEEEIPAEPPQDRDETLNAPNFQQVFLTCPDGLTLNFSRVNPGGVADEPSALLVKQSYPFKTHGKHRCEESRSHPAMAEVSRVIRHDGTVIKNMADGTAIIFYADGAVSHLTGVPPGQRILGNPETPARTPSGKSERDVTTPTRRGKKVKEQKVQSSSDDVDVAEQNSERRGQWVTTAPTGERCGMTLDGVSLELPSTLVSYASDPETGQMMITREDLVTIVTFPDEVKIVEHEDRTRITTFFRNIEEAKDGTSSLRQQFVRVECPGYAAVEFNCFTSYCMVQFGNDTVMTVTPAGRYFVSHADGFSLVVDERGEAVYMPSHSEQADPTELLPARVGLNTPSPLDQMDKQHDHHCYVMSHKGPTILQTSDPHKNSFVVLSDGSHTVTLSEEFQQLQQENSKSTFAGMHTPRFFIIRPDLSGTELLKREEITSFLQKAELDTSVAIIKEPVLEQPGVTAITVLKPLVKDLSQKWFGHFSTSTIIPAGLQSRNLNTVPSREIKTEGPRFGTTVGKGLAVGSAVKEPTKRVLLECPQKLEMRQIIQYKPLTHDQRQRLYGSLKLYADYVLARESHSEEIKIKDPRTTSAKGASTELLQNTRDLLLKADIKSLYEKVTAPPVPSPPSTPRPRRSLADIERDKREKAQELMNKILLRDKIVQPYFESEMGKGFLISAAQDEAGMMEHLSEDPRRDAFKAVRGASLTADRLQDMGDDSPSSATRPVGPTPVHASGQGSPSHVRPQNPTPAQSSKAFRQTNKAHTTNNEKHAAIQEQPLNEFTGGELSNQNQLSKSGEFSVPTGPSSLAFDVIGQLRSQPVHIPDYITKSSRPNCISNTRHHVENDARRKVKTSSVAQVMIRGLEVMPNSVDFGVLKEGFTYSFTVFLKNVGVDACRYKLRAPPPSTGLKLLYVPGSIAAGMKAELRLELYAMAVGVAGESGVGVMSHDLEITTETDLMLLPIKATIMTADEYEKKASSNSVSIKNPGVKFVTDKPPNNYGIIRPRKDLKTACNGSDAVLSILS